MVFVLSGHIMGTGGHLLCIRRDDYRDTSHLMNEDLKGQESNSIPNFSGGRHT